MDVRNGAPAANVPKSPALSLRSSPSQCTLPVNSPRHTPRRSLACGAATSVKKKIAKEEIPKEGATTGPGKRTSSTSLTKSTTASHRSSSSHSALRAHLLRQSSRRSLPSGLPSRAHFRGSNEYAEIRGEGKKPGGSLPVNREKLGKPQRRAQSVSPVVPPDVNTPAGKAASPTATTSATGTSLEAKTIPSAKKPITSNVWLTTLASWIGERLKKSKLTRLLRSRQAARIALATVLLVLATAAALAVYYSYSALSGTQRFDADDSGICVSAACQEHASYFRKRLDTQINPCTDLDAYVCSRWSTTSGIAHNFAKEMAISWSVNATRFLTKAIGRGLYFTNGSVAHHTDAAVIPGGRAVEAFFRKCIAQKDDDPDSLHRVREFAAAIGIPWPYDIAGSAARQSEHPFAVLIQLNTLWGLDLWSQMVVLKNIRGKPVPPMLVIRKTGMAAGWLDFVTLLDNNGGRREYYKEIHSLYRVPMPNDTTITCHLNLEREVLTTLAATFNETDRLAVHTTVAQLQSHFSNLNGYQLAKTIISAFQTSGIHAHSRVYIDSRRYLADADWLLGEFGKRQLLEHISWWYAQMCALMVSRKARVLIAGNEAGSRMLKSLRCLQSAAGWFGPALYYNIDDQYFTAEQRRTVDSFLRALTLQAKSGLKTTTWIDQRTRLVMERRLHDLSVVAWSEQLESSGVPRLDQSTEAFSIYWQDPKKEFLETWVAAARQRVKEKGVAGLMRAEKYWIALPFTGVLYAYQDNRVTVSHAVIAPPLFYAHMRSALLRAASFGGLATAFLDAAIRMFDLQGIRMEGGQPISWMSPSAEHQLYQRLRCSSGIDENLLQVASLRLSWDAYKNSTGDSTLGEQLGILDWSGSQHFYTPDQIFFLTYCLRLCNTGSHCSAAARSLPDFGSIFGCGKPAADEDQKNQCRFFA